MRNRDLFIPSITTLILFGFVWFLSCAHQNSWREEADGSLNQAAEEQLGYADTADLSPEEKPEAQAQIAPETNPTEASSSPSNEFSFDADETDSSFSLGEETSSPDSLAQNSLEVPPAPEEPSTTEPTPTESIPPVSSAPIDEEVTPQPELEANEFETEESEPVPAPIKKATWSGKLPEIPSQAVTRKGMKLNRFYFSRLGDTPNSVSKLIYSDIKHAKKLVAWNGANWKPGTIIYYLSALDPKDSRMGSFYKEHSIEPEEYTIKSGDWLSRIAKMKLGSALSWKEIGVINGLKRPSALEVGERLAIYPKDLVGARTKKPEQIAQAPEALPDSPEPERFEEEPLSPPQLAPAPPVTQPQVEEPQALVAPAPPSVPSEAQAPAEEVAATEPPPSPAQEMNWEQFIEQESLAILIGAALIVLLLALRVRKKRLKNRGTGSGGSSEEGYSEEPSSKYGKGR